MNKILWLVTILAIPAGFSIPDMEVICDILAIAVDLLVCAALIAIGVLGVLNAICRWKLKKEGVTDEDMDDLQRRMLGYVVKNRQEVKDLLWWGQVWGGNKVRRIHVVPAEPMPEVSANIVDFNEWRERHLEAAE